MSCEVDNDDNPIAECPPKTMEEVPLTGKDLDSVDGENESSMNTKEKSENKAEKEISDGCNAENMPKSVNMEPSLDSKTSGNVEISISVKSDEELPSVAQTVVEMPSQELSNTSQVDNTEDKQQETRSQTNNLHTTDFTTATTTTADESSSTAEYADHITYTNEGEAIYTDPKTQYKYKWNAKEHKWVYWRSGSSKSADAASNGMEDVYENEHYKWCPERHQWIPKAQKADDKPETEHYKWDEVKNAWIPKVNTMPQATDTEHDGVIYGIDKDGQRIYTDKDGVDFFWDCNKSAWFPKIDDDFMARYQMSYGFIDNTSAIEEERKLKEEAEERRKADELRKMTEEARAAAAATAAGVKPSVTKRKATQEPASWFDLNPEQNTKVYVSNLPLDITLDEFAEVMSKCGMIMRDPQTQKSKLKLYTEADGQIKGDGLCDYIKIESVDLALKILDESEVRGHKIRVQRAQFQMRGEYNPALKPKRKKKDKEKMQKMKEKLFDWRPEKMRGERSKNEKVVIIKNLFTPELFEKEVQLILDYQNDLREECSKCGTVRKVVIYDLHPEGVAQINMSCPEEADVVIQMMHGRYFGQRQLTAEHWDGKTKYKIAETETAVKSRLNNWDEFLESDAEKKPATSTEPTAAATSREAVTTDTLGQE